MEEVEEIEVTPDWGEETPDSELTVEMNCPVKLAEVDDPVDEEDPLNVDVKPEVEPEPEEEPLRVPTGTELKLLRPYAGDLWRFLVAVAFCDKSNVVDEEILGEFFRVFPDAESVEDVGWFDVQQLLSRWDACDVASEQLARCIARTSYDYRVWQKDPSVKSKGPDVLKLFHRANAFWRSCYDVVFDRDE
jgi:hypothetical protein